MRPNFDLEQQYCSQVVAGVDEAGVGPLAGPVVAAAVIIDRHVIIPGINDSKKLSAKQRQLLYDQIIAAYQCATAIVLPAEIDRINIRAATIKACQTAVNNLCLKVDIVIIDGNMKFADHRFISVIGGDKLSVSVAASSIVAKVTRDRFMTELGREFPQYLWHKNFGYGTLEHRRAIMLCGQSPHHRRSFRQKISLS